MPAGNYDINAEQGTTFTLYMNYQDSSSNAINLASYTNGRMQVRRSQSTDKLVLSMDKNGVTGGGSTGEFGVIFGGTGATFDGTKGTGGIELNTGTAGGSSTAALVTGGIYIDIDATTMKNVPVGRFLYDIELVRGATVDRILQGNFNVSGEITR